MLVLLPDKLTCGNNKLTHATMLNIEVSGDRTIGSRTQDGRKVGNRNVSRTGLRLKEVRQGTIDHGAFLYYMSTIPRPTLASLIFLDPSYLPYRYPLKFVGDQSVAPTSIVNVSNSPALASLSPTAWTSIVHGRSISPQSCTDAMSRYGPRKTGV